MFGRQVSPLVVGAGALLLGGIVYTQMSPSDDAITGKSTTTKSSSASKTTTTDSLFEPIDYTAKYASLEVPVRDSFKPLISKGIGGGGEKGFGLPGDKGTWIYSGMVQLNGDTQGLMENRTEGDSSYVTQGEHWRDVTVQTIQPDYIVLSGADGPITLKAGDDGQNKAITAGDLTADGSAGNTPLTVPGSLTGPIGQGQTAMTTTTDPNGAVADVQLQPDQNGQRQGWRGRRRAQRGGDQGN
jgi:hypothetical protein